MTHSHAVLFGLCLLCLLGGAGRVSAEPAQEAPARRLVAFTNAIQSKPLADILGFMLPETRGPIEAAIAKDPTVATELLAEIRAQAARIEKLEILEVSYPAPDLATVRVRMTLRGEPPETHDESLKRIGLQWFVVAF